MTTFPPGVQAGPSAAPTSIADVLGALASAVADAKASLARLNGQIEDLEQERARIVNAPPHADDIAAVFLRGLDAAGRNFLTKLGAHLNDRNWSTERGAAYVQSSSIGQLLTSAATPHPDALTPSAAVGGVPAAVSLDADAVVYFLRDQIASEVPALVDKLCPAARRGMTQVDRVASLRDLDARLGELHAARDQMHADMAAAKAAAR